MNENKTILTIILVSVLVIYVLFFSYIMIRYVARSGSAEKKDDADSSGSKNKLSLSPHQTDFYNKSVEHAEKVLFGKAFDPQYGEANYYGNKLMDIIGKINNETKQAIVLAIKYFSIEPNQARVNEQTFRMMASQEKVPLWFVILREATKKAVPDFMQEQNTSNNIVPISRVA